MSKNAIRGLIFTKNGPMAMVRGRGEEDPMGVVERRYCVECGAKAEVVDLTGDELCSVCFDLSAGMTLAQLRPMLHHIAKAAPTCLRDHDRALTDHEDLQVTAWWQRYRREPASRMTRRERACAARKFLRQLEAQIAADARFN